MGNDNFEEARPVAAPEADALGAQQDATPTHDSISIHPDTTSLHPLPSIDETRAEGSQPRVSQQDSRQPSASARFLERRGTAGQDGYTPAEPPRRMWRRGTDLAEHVVDHPSRSNTASARNLPRPGDIRRADTSSSKWPKPGELRKAETRFREEQWLKTVASPSGPSGDFERRPQDGNGEPLPMVSSLRRRATGRPRADSTVSRVSILPSAPGEAGLDPTFTLAGPNDAVTANMPFVERGYAILNPAYEQPSNNRPVWGLAKPLPRVVRPGMVPSLSELNVPTLSVVNNQDPGVAVTQGKASRAWDLAIAAARSKKDRRTAQSMAPDEVELSENRPARPNISQSPADNTYLTPPIPEYPAEGGSEPFPDADAGSSTTEVHENDNVFDTSSKFEVAAFLDEVHNNHTKWSEIRTRFREPLAELLAVIIQLTLGFCADLAATTSNNTGDTTAWAWGLATMVGIYISGGISGAHLNPALSVTLWIYRGFPLRKIPIYVFAQILGAFIAALIAFGIYQEGIIHYGGSNLANGGTVNDFVTSRRFDWMTAPTAFFNEFVATAILSATVMALGDDSNAPPGAGMNSLIIGLVITVIIMAFGHNTGAACNPSRDFGPRLALLALGYGDSLFTSAYWFYGPWVACTTGAIVGAGLYDFAIFTGGESPINYPSHKMKRAARKWKKRMEERAQRASRFPKKLRSSRRQRSSGYEETEDKTPPV